MDPPDKGATNTSGSRNKKYSFSIRRLRLSLKYRPEILRLVLKMRQCIRDKNVLLKKLMHQLKYTEQQRHTLNPTGKDKENDLDDFLSLKTSGITKQDDPNKLIGSHTLLKTDNMTESNADGNFTNREVIFIDKSASYEYIVKDNFSQTNTDNHVCKNPCVEKDSDLSNNLHKNPVDELVVSDSLTEDSGVKPAKEKSTIEDKILSNTDPVNLNVKEASTQTDFPLKQASNAVDICLNKSDNGKTVLKNRFTQTDNTENAIEKPVADDKGEGKEKSLGWTNTDNGDEEKSIAEQVKEVAQCAMEQSGMVYVESVGMYYDYKTGYYYNSELGLYYHTDTGCYYYYSNDQKFVFHSYPDRSQTRPKKPIRRPKKHTTDEANAEASKPKRRRLTKRHKKSEKVNKKDIRIKDTENDNKKKAEQNDEIEEKEIEVEKKEDRKLDQDLEDGECSDSADEKSDSSDNESDASTATASDDESVAKHHPPCMRIIVRETSLPKLKVGSLFLVTKDGGTIGREGEHHTILLKDYNVSRDHLDIKFNADKRMYTAVDLGSKNGSILNGVRMSESQEVSDPIEVVHGSTLQVGETKLLCHIHAGNDTCGHCEPGLIIEAEDKEKKAAYTRTCSVQKQHQLELARLKNKYAPQPLQIEETAYNDRAQARRETVGSTHSSEKTQCSDLDTAIAADNKGFKLLEKMGWSKGEGLGKDSQGDKEPIPLVSNDGKSGLGATATPSAARVVTSKIGSATLRLAARTKMLQPPAKAFQQPAEEDSE